MAHSPLKASELSREEAQRRADQIAAFRRELEEVRTAGVLVVEPGARSRLDGFHDDLLARLARQFDVDQSDSQRQMSVGMRAISLVGACALSAAVFFFFYRFWGLIGPAPQVAVLIAIPVALLGGVEVAARRERTLYVAAILALVACASFGIDLGVLFASYNLAPSPWPFGAWAVFTLAVAYSYRFRLLLAGGFVAALFFVCAEVSVLAGVDWSAALLRTEPMALAGALLLATAGWRANVARSGFPATVRVIGALAVFIPVLLLANVGEFSYLPIPVDSIEAIYSAAGFLLPALGIWVGLRRRWRDMVNASSACLIVFTYAKSVDWAWDWMPRYLFFLLLGALAVVILVLLRRLRAQMKQV